MINKEAKPFLKWAGGKTHILSLISEVLPYDMFDEFTYIEPFVGSGAVLFWVLERNTNLKKAVINDINKDLVDSYRIVQADVENLIDILSDLENEFYKFIDNDDLKKEYYYDKRDLFNKRISDQTTQTALFIFLNKTCFNGLYRVNRNNKFNVPIGSYKKPLICNASNLRLANKALYKVDVLCGDYEETIKYVEDKTFFYFDPPYKPLSQTSSFNSYTKDLFDDNEQIRLKNFCDKLNELGYKWALSNSDIDNYFDNLYSNYEIERIFVKRTINADASKRGELTELLIKN